MKKELTFGLIVGSRGFFPHHLAKEGREEMVKVLTQPAIRWSCSHRSKLSTEPWQTPDGVESCRTSTNCAMRQVLNPTYDAADRGQTIPDQRKIPSSLEATYVSWLTNREFHTASGLLQADILPQKLSRRCSIFMMSGPGQAWPAPAPEPAMWKRRYGIDNRTLLTEVGQRAIMPSISFTMLLEEIGSRPRIVRRLHGSVLSLLR